MKGIKLCLLLQIFVTTTFSLSFQGQEEIKSNMILTHDNIDPPKKSYEETTKSVIEDQALTSQRDEMRKMRLYILGALTEQIVAWFFQDLVPKSVMQRTKRSLNVPGKTFYQLTVNWDFIVLGRRHVFESTVAGEPSKLRMLIFVDFKLLTR